MVVHRQRSRLLRSLLRPLAALLLSLLVLGCDGGTRGTGGARLAILGIVNDQTGTMPQADLIVTGELQDDLGVTIDVASDITDLAGSFYLQFESHGAAVRFRFSAPGIDAESELQEIPGDAEQIRIGFEVSGNSAEVVETDFSSDGTDGGKSEDPRKDDDLPKPNEGIGDGDDDGREGSTPDETPEPTAFPTPGPTELPTAVPTPTPSPTPIADDGPDEGAKIIICHHAQSQSGQTQTIEVPASAVASHLAHGDELGACPDDGTGNNGKKPPKKS